MDVIKALRDYVTKMVRLPQQGMKVLLLDSETAGIVSMVYSQSEILQEEVYLFERLDTVNREIMIHLKAICFLRPTDENLELLKKDLQAPKYKEYYLFFTNILSKEYLEQLAQADGHQVVQEVQEFYGDYFAVNCDVWTLNLPEKACLSSIDMDDSTRTRIVQGLVSCLLSLKQKPYIRYQKNSPLSSQIALEVMQQIRINKSLFNFKFSAPQPLLLILDRRDDSVTPLLTQWTYQAMVHELIGIENDLVKISHSTLTENDTVVLSPHQDTFYRENMFKDFGDLGTAVKGLFDEYQKKQQSNKEIKSIEDIKKFLMDYPQFKKLSGNVSKHMAIMDQLQKQISKRHLLDLSEQEQKMTCNESYSEATRKIEELLNAKSTDFDGRDLLRLVMLYALRYERQKDCQQNLNNFHNILKGKFDLSLEDLRLIQTITRYGGNQNRSQSSSLFESANSNLLEKLLKTFDKGLTGVTNIYTQHKPLIHRIVSVDLQPKGRLSEEDYPYHESVAPAKPPSNILIFIVGGITFEEARWVNELNNTLPNNNIVLGGTSILNSNKFLEALKEYK